MSGTASNLHKTNCDSFFSFFSSTSKKKEERVSSTLHFVDVSTRWLKTASDPHVEENCCFHRDVEIQGREHLFLLVKELAKQKGTESSHCHVLKRPRAKGSLTYAQYSCGSVRSEKGTKGEPKFQ